MMTEKAGSKTVGKASAVRLSQHLDLSGQLEVLQLKEKLQEMTEVVRQLLKHMEQLEKVHGFFSMDGTQRDSVATQTSPSEEKSLEMSLSLKVKMKELVDMNLNWQKYNALQEKHIQELHNKVEQMQQELTVAEDNNQLLKKQLLDENSRLKAEVEKLRMRNDASQSAAKAKRTRGDAEREQLLEAQLMVYRDDFQVERRDREAAQARVVQLEMELLELTRKTQTTSTGFPYRAPRYAVDECDLQVDGECHQNSTTIEENHAGVDCADGPPSSKAVLPADSNKEKASAGGRSRRSGVDKKPPSGAKEDILCCTKCFKVFPRSEHLDLLDHLEECDRL